MIYVFCVSEKYPGGYTHEFHTKENALRFIKSAHRWKIDIIGYSCDDPEDNEWLNMRC